MDDGGNLFSGHSDTGAKWVFSASFIDNNSANPNSNKARLVGFELFEVGGSLTAHGRPNRYEEYTATVANSPTDLTITGIDGVIFEVHCQDFVMDPEDIEAWGVGTSALQDGCSSSGCGNGSVDSGEECDDGNIDDGDGCDSSCLEEAACGNSVVEGSETCDDGNDSSGDGCDSCQVEEGWDCTDDDCTPICDDDIEVPTEDEVCRRTTQAWAYAPQTLPLLTTAACATTSIVSTVPGPNMIMAPACIQIARMQTLMQPTNDNQQDTMTQGTSALSLDFRFQEVITDKIFA